ncbi:RsmB/NOP family class I SAM-dependent RNA methyltransferase [Candidatus Woesearchaeota archaeon]|nr:RsmB/NOP family class I SAM-dependent RNA methyltransferase [Candidatus Woesearchaeota archaeon]MBW3006144.1 RsmB/NOP family class I SAM-dependent RNA methyltransferase [Candidatus Woesearchaeota archaeon]
MEKGMNFFLDRYKELGETVSSIKLKPALRINTLNISEEKLINRLKKQGVKLEKVPYAKHGYFYSSRFSLGSIAEYLLGYFYLQESAAQLPVQVLDPKPDETVLDCCAAPGGKTTQIAQFMKNKGLLIAVEKKSHRITSLRTNLERCGINNCIVYAMDANKVDSLNMKFDKILLDAPCSGNFITDPTWFKKRSLDGIRRNAEIQKSLIEKALSVLKKGGTLIYSTCSLEPEENELNMQWMLNRFKVKIEKNNLKIGDSGLTKVFDKKLDKQIANCSRFWPNKTNTEGFFIAKIRKL